MYTGMLNDDTLTTFYANNSPMKANTNEASLPQSSQTDVNYNAMTSPCANSITNSSPMHSDESHAVFYTNDVINNENVARNLFYTMADPKMTKYRDVDKTGATMLCTTVRNMRAISKR